MGARELHPHPGPLERLNRLAIKRLGGLAFAQQRPRARLDPERPISATGRGRLRKLTEGIGRELRLAAAGGRLDQLDQPPRCESYFKRVLGGLLRRGQRLLVTASAVMEYSGRPVNECQPLSLAPTQKLVRGRLDQRDGLGVVALEGGQCQRCVRCEAGTYGLVDRHQLVDERRGRGQSPREQMRPGACRQCQREHAQRTGITREPDEARRELVPGLVVPQKSRDTRREPQPPPAVPSGHVLVSERVDRPPQRRRSRGVSLRGQQRQAIQQQVRRARRLRRWRRRPGSPRGLQYAPAGRQPAREEHGGERLQIGFPREPVIERFQPLGGLQQQRRRVAAAVQPERDLTVQQIDLRALELGQRSGLCDDNQSECGVERTGLVLGLGRGERPPSPARGLGRQRGGTVQKRGCCRQATPRLSAARRALQLRRDILVEARTSPGRDAKHGDRDRPHDRSRPPARDARPAAPAATPLDTPPSGPAGDETSPARRSRATHRSRPPPGPRSRAARPRATPAPGRRPAPPPPPATAAGYRPGVRRSLRRKLSSIRPDSPDASNKPNPPASCAGVNPRGNSNNANGFPRVSATSRSRTRSIQRHPHHRPQQHARVIITQTLDHQLPESCERFGRVARHEQQPDRLRQQPPRHEHQRLRRRPIKPLRVINHTHQRPLPGHRRQQAQHRQPHQKPIRRIPRTQPKRHPQRIPLRSRKTVQTIEHRRAQLLQRRER